MKFEQKIIQTVIKANTELRPDMRALLKAAYIQEKNKKAKQALKIILENAEIARRRRLAICQDTGLPVVFLEVGKDIRLNGSLMARIMKAVSSGYREGGFRASTIDRNNILSFNPNIFHVDFTQGKGLTVTVFPKGFGSENKSKLKVFRPTASREEINEFIIDAIRDAGPDACPPYIIGIGVGGTCDWCLLLSKKALLERLDNLNPDKQLNKWERQLYKKINALRIGPMGLGGKFTCLAVRIKMYPTHIAGLPVGVNISCHALRSAQVTINEIYPE